jgi:acetyltransferase-like isoleucine patch superfamily enzyme
MGSLYHFLACSDHALARLARQVNRTWGKIALPAPRLIFLPLLWFFLGTRSVIYFFKRVFICEPFFKTYCTDYGRNLRTGVFIHWIQGRGNLIIGDHVTLDGKSSFLFAARFSSSPTLTIGDHTYIGHDCTFSVGKAITIGKHCLIAGGVWMLDSNGHPTKSVQDRIKGQPPPPEEVRPIVVEDNVWIGGRSIICPGVIVGEGSIVAAGSLVRTRVAPYTIVAGNPACPVASLEK